MSEKIPYTKIMDKMKDDIDYIVDEAYNSGYNEAKLIYQNPHAEADYQKGLDDAWEAARKLFSSMADSDIEKAFPIEWNNGGFKALMNLQPQEAIAKLQAYEEKKKADPEIKVGDEVIATSGKAVVYGVFTGNDKTLGCRYLYSDGTLGWNSATALTKTGRHFPQITEVLETMKGGEE